ncbi:MAG: nucleotidyl transferase AbiEii/AbiGii toxin family protein [Candidatus Daviesbacteria bacterium]|nr:nucleotidyl transferase AbiEii/AbiGii toxin family protein [Candidatus Daviesbacteria bacterium]
MIALTYLHNFYKNKTLSNHIHLEGGTALSLFYKINRKFSNDLDFSVETLIDLRRFQQEITKPLGIFYKAKVIDDVKICILDSNNYTILTIDSYLAASENCQYEEVMLEGITPCVIHSLIDILAEKLCCMIDRDTERDVYDSAKIIKSRDISLNDLATLFENKQKVKQDGYNTLSQFTENLYKIKQQKINWVRQGDNLNYIYKYLSN